MIEQLRLLPLKIYRMIIAAVSRTGIPKMSFAKKIHSMIIPRLVPKKIHVDGHTMYIDERDYLYLSTKGYEPLERKILESIVNEGDTVVDIGANLGYFTLILARKVGSKGKVFAIEPDPDMFALLKKNVEVNGYKNVVLIKKAAMNKNKKFKLEIYAGKGDSGVICPDVKKGSKPSKGAKKDMVTVTIDGIKLDDYFKNYTKNIDFIKMDIEGSEGVAFAGMVETLRRSNDAILITEFFPKFMENHEVDADKYYDLLVREGFRLFSIDETNNSFKKITRKNQVIKKHDKGYYFTNLLCIKGGNLDKIIKNVRQKIL